MIIIRKLEIYATLGATKNTCCDYKRSRKAIASSTILLELAENMVLVMVIQAVSGKIFIDLYESRKISH